MIKQQRKEGGEACVTCEPTVQPSSSNTVAPTPMEVDADTEAQPADIKTAAVETVSSPPKVTKKKKKKKTSYKDMMANMTKRTKDEMDIQKEKEGLRKVTGGGTFSKIDKI